jgi:molybdopterin biosynthesis enzyme
MRKLVPLSAAAEALAAAAAAFVEIEAIALDAATGCVLASDAVAPAAVPETSRALRAGFAVHAADTLDASPLSPLPLAATARPVAAGEPLPPGTDAVLSSNGVRRTAAGLEAIATVAPSDDVRRRGEDAQRGDILLPAGSALSPVRIAALSALGVGDVRVRRPRVALPIAAADVAGGMFRRIVEASGGVVVSASQRAAIVIASTIDQGRGDTIALQPGLGEASLTTPREGPPELMVPARLEAALAIAYALLVPLIDRLSGRGDARPALTLPLAAKIAVAPGIANAVLVRREGDRWRPLAAADLPLSAVAAADAIAILDPGCEGLAPGAPLTGLLLAAYA